jgi:cytochrome c
MYYLTWFSALAFGLFSLGADAAGDAKRGANILGQCLGCHSTEPGEHLTGPSLAKVINRRAASLTDFTRYSDALKRSNLTWNEATLDKWLANPAKVVPGTSMTFPGIKDSRARQDIIAFLRATDEGKAPSAEGRGGKMGGMQVRKPNLKEAPAAGQVRSMRHGGDTYAVETADGKTEKVWEFNLRFKTDSSKLGPERGKPVVVGAGMQGDRASVVFSNPAEISAFIKESCQ